MTLARRAVTRFPTRQSPERVALRQHAVLLCLGVDTGTTDRDGVDDPIERPRLCDAIGPDSIPPPRLLCEAVDRFAMVVLRPLPIVAAPDPVQLPWIASITTVPATIGSIGTELRSVIVISY
jgi:hypothetical protein